MDKTITKWVIGSIVVPMLLAALSIFGVHIKDYLFPAPIPEVEDRTVSFEERLTILETQLNTLMTVLHLQPMPNDAQSTNNPNDALSNNTRVPDSETFKQEIEVKNDSQYSGRKLYVGKKAWEWTIYIDSEPSVLQNILRVTYQLHPTFTDPIKIIREPGKTSKAFPYSTTGWGTFNVGVRIEFKDGSELTTNHYLVFRE